MIRRAVLAVALLGLLAACRVDVTVDLTIGPDGTGELAVTAVADADVVGQAPGLADDLRFDDAVAAGWVVDGPTATDDGGLTVTLRHPVTSAAEATNLLASLGPPFADMRLERTPSADGEETTNVLSGQLTLPAGFDSFADSDLLAAVGGTPYADELAAAGATPAGSMAVTLRAGLPGDVEETTGRRDGEALVWEAPLDGLSTAVTARAVQRPPSGGGWAGAVSTLALVLLVLWVAAATAFIVSVARARPPPGPQPPAPDDDRGARMRVAETEVAIVGAGPAGLVLSHLLAARGIDCVVLEQRDRDYVEHRVRAGVLEHPTVELLRSLGLAGRLDREGLAHRGIELAFEGRRHRIDFLDLTGRSITVYGQQEVVKDLIAARLAAGGEIVFEALDVAPVGVTGERPVVRYRHDDDDHELRCRYVAGCDGFHGVCRDLVPGLQVFEREYPFGWLGILAEAAPTLDELIYANHARGFALYSMRSPTITRLYLQVPADEAIEEWPDDRIWDELHTRLPTNDDFRINTGPVIEKGITAMRAFVAAPMRHGRLLLAGDAAHIVPPTGAKGMNLAIADVFVMAGLLDDALRAGRPEGLDTYTATCLRRVWRAQHFSSWMTSMLHRFGDDPFQHQLQLSELALVTGSVVAATNLAQNYVGLPFGDLYGGAA